jgi:hypothetical protein
MEKNSKDAKGSRGQRAGGGARSLARSIAILQLERTNLEEEVHQLRAAVQVYNAVVERLAHTAGARMHSS